MTGAFDAVDVSPAPDWLSDALREVETTGWAAEIYDADWQLRWVSPELRFLLRAEQDSELGIGKHMLEVYSLELWRRRLTQQSHERSIRNTLPHILATGSDGLRELELDEMTRALVAGGEIEPLEAPVWANAIDFLQDDLPPIRVQAMTSTLFDAGGRRQGYLRIYGPGLRASILSLVARGDEGMFERMSRLVTPERRRVAIMFCDLEGSVSLSRRLPSQIYFELITAMLKRVDDIVVRHEGVVGKHAGDGASAFFLADDHGDVSAAARAAISAAREIRDEVPQVARQILLDAGIEEIDEFHVNVGLHFSATVYIGQMVTGGRLEVTALGDQVNECARLEAAAHNGQILAAKDLVERLNPVDAEEVGIEPNSQTYKLLADLAEVPRKVSREIGQLPVCEL